MQVVRGFLDDLGLTAPSPSVSIGNFDGVHRGHQAVIGSAIDDARRRHALSVVCTFEPHTRLVLEPDSPPDLLQTLEQRLAAFEDLGVDVTVVIPFDEKVAKVSKETFVESFLRDRIRVTSLHVSDAFSFGRGGAGNAGYLVDVAETNGFTVTLVTAVLEEGRPVSSTWIRQLIRAGEVEKAAGLLGRAPALIGTVVAGAARGQGLEAPTANLDAENGCLPAAGVYVAEARLGSGKHRAVCNIGIRPTFGSNGALTVEAHLLDYAGDLYGQRLELAFFKRLRDEIAFASPDALMIQIREDVRRALAFFEG